MHIPENYLSPATCAAMGAIMLPVWYRAIKQVEIKVKEDKEIVPMLGITTSLSFLIMMFNLPAPGGTTAHAVGAVLIAILMDPWTATLSISVALSMQAFLFGDGGILALAANCFTMAFLMPFTGYGIYKLITYKGKHQALGAFLGGYLGINVAALAVAVLLGIQPLLFKDSNGNPLYNPYPLAVTVSAMGLTHLLIGFVEGFFTMGVCQFVHKLQEGEMKSALSNKSRKDSKISYLLILIAAMISLTPLGLLATGDAFAEWDLKSLVENLSQYHLHQAAPAGMAKGWSFSALLSDYRISGLPEVIGYILCALSAVLIFFIIYRIIFHRKMVK